MERYCSFGTSTGNASTMRRASWEFHWFSTASTAFQRVARSAYPGGRMGWQHDLGVDKFFVLVVEFGFLVILAEQPFAALVSGPGNGGLPLAALDDGDFEMRTRNTHHPR